MCISHLPICAVEFTLGNICSLHEHLAAAVIDKSPDKCKAPNDVHPKYTRPLKPSDRARIESFCGELNYLVRLLLAFANYKAFEDKKSRGGSKNWIHHFLSNGENFQPLN